VPLGTVNAEELNDPARPPLMFVLQGRWATWKQLDSGHLVLQDDQPDGHIGACRAFGTQLQPTALYRYTIDYWLRLLDSTNVQNPAEHSSGRRMCLFLSTPRPYLRVAECANSNGVQVADFLGVEK